MSEELEPRCWVTFDQYEVLRPRPCCAACDGERHGHAPDCTLKHAEPRQRGAWRLELGQGLSEWERSIVRPYDVGAPRPNPDAGDVLELWPLSCIACGCWYLLRKPSSGGGLCIGDRLELARHTDEHVRGKR